MRIECGLQFQIWLPNLNITQYGKLIYNFRQYEDTWPLSPWHYSNNIQGIGRGSFNGAQILADPVLAVRETDYVRKVVHGGGIMKLVTPVHSIDIALRIMRTP